MSSKIFFELITKFDRKSMAQHLRRMNPPDIVVIRTIVDTLTKICEHYYINVSGFRDFYEKLTQSKAKDWLVESIMVTELQLHLVTRQKFHSNNTYRYTCLPYCKEDTPYDSVPSLTVDVCTAVTSDSESDSGGVIVADRPKKKQKLRTSIISNVMSGSETEEDSYCPQDPVYGQRWSTHNEDSLEELPGEDDITFTTDAPSNRPQVGRRGRVKSDKTIAKSIPTRATTKGDTTVKRVHATMSQNEPADSTVFATPGCSQKKQEVQKTHTGTKSQRISKSGTRKRTCQRAKQLIGTSMYDFDAANVRRYTGSHLKCTIMIFCREKKFISLLCALYGFINADDLLLQCHSVPADKDIDEFLEEKWWSITNKNVGFQKSLRELQTRLAERLINGYSNVLIVTRKCTAKIVEADFKARIDLFSALTWSEQLKFNIVFTYETMNYLTFINTINIILQEYLSTDSTFPAYVKIGSRVCKINLHLCCIWPLDIIRYLCHGLVRNYLLISPPHVCTIIAKDDIFFPGGN